MTAVLALVPATQFSGWQWVSLALAGPVAVWGGWPLHQAGWLGLRRGGAPADLLASLAILAALGWSAAALLLGGAGTLGARQSFAWTLTAAGSGTIFFGAAAGMTVTALAARWLSGEPVTAQRGDGVEPGSVSADGGSAAWDAASPDPAGRAFRVAGAAAAHGAADGPASGEWLGGGAGGPRPDQDGAARRGAVLGPCVIAAAAATLGFWLGTGLPAAAAWGAAIAVLAAASPAGLAVPPAARPAARRARADLTAALGSAAAAEAILAGDLAAVADATLAAADPRAVAAAVEVARTARAVARASLRWAVGYNVLVIPVAALGYLNPLLAGLAMAASTVIVRAGARRVPGGASR